MGYTHNRMPRMLEVDSRYVVVHVLIGVGTAELEVDVPPLFFPADDSFSHAMTLCFILCGV